MNHQRVTKCFQKDPKGFRGFPINSQVHLKNIPKDLQEKLSRAPMAFPIIYRGFQVSKSLQDFASVFQPSSNALEPLKSL